jgi:hypothetical protein
MKNYPEPKEIDMLMNARNDKLMKVQPKRSKEVENVK